MDSGDIAVDGHFIARLDVISEYHHLAIIRRVMSIGRATSLFPKFTSGTKDSSGRRASTSMDGWQNWFKNITGIVSGFRHEALDPLKVRMSQLEMVQ